MMEMVNDQVDNTVALLKFKAWDFFLSYLSSRSFKSCD